MKKIGIAMLILAALLCACGKTGKAETAPADPKTVAPLPADLSLEELDNCVFAAAFEPSDVYMSQGNLVISLVPNYAPKYDREQVDALNPGDTLVLGGENVTVESVQRKDNHVAVNGGTEAGGCDLYLLDMGAYIQVIPDAGTVYAPLGTVTLCVDPNFVFTDNSDPQNQGLQISAGDFLLAMENRVDSFAANATLVRTENGCIVELTKEYLP